MVIPLAGIITIAIILIIMAAKGTITIEDIKKILPGDTTIGTKDINTKDTEDTKK